MIAFFIDAQMTALRLMMQEMMNNDSHVDESTEEERHNSSVSTEKESDQSKWTERWNSSNIDFFDSNYENDKTDLMIHTDRDTVFRDVHLFNKRVKNLATTKSNKLIAENLYTCLRDIVLKWYTSELFDMKKRLLKLSLKKWTDALTTSFKKSSSVTLIIIITKKYIMNNVYRRRESRQYAQVILCDVKSAEMNFVYNQLFLIYNDIDLELWRDLKSSESITTLNF